MKKLILITLTFLIALLVSGCTTKNEYGPCIGLAGPEDPKLKYEVSYKNIAIAVLFSEIPVVPIVTAVWDYKCPIK